MNLPTPPPNYSPADQAAMRREIQRADTQNLKRGQDVEIANGRLIMTDIDDGLRYQVVLDGGALTFIAL